MRELSADRAALLAYMRPMTPAQRFAFTYPATDVRAAQDGRFSHMVDDRRGDTAWRVLVMIDATGGPEGWPCWHCTAVYGESVKGVARPAAPLFAWAVPGEPRRGWAVEWPNMRFRKAEALIRRELAGVGLPETLEVTSRDELMAEGLRLGADPTQVVGLSGRVRLSVYEAAACLPAPLLAQFTAVRMEE